MCTVGIVIGCYAAGPFMNKGRLRLLFLANILLIVGSLLSISYSNVTLIIIGKIIYGMSGGFFNVICPKMTNEIAPREISGAAGTIW